MPKKNNAQALTPTCHPERKHIAKGLCKQCYDAEYRKSHREHLNKISRDWALRNPEKISAANRKYLYGVEPEVVKARFNAQDGLCKICGKASADHLDHDHRTGLTRGLLCGDCNRGLGIFRDDPERLQQAARYLIVWAKFNNVQVIPNTGVLVGHSTRGLD